MSENNHMDDLMRSLLENAREDVPEHIWEGVSTGLDKAARRKAAIVWFRRAGAVAAAAAVVIGVWLHVRQNDTLVPEAEGSDMIAVVESETTENSDMMAKVVEIPVPVKTIISARESTDKILEEGHDATVEEPMVEDQTPAEPVVEDRMAERKKKEDAVPAEKRQEDTGGWQENERESRENRIRTSLTISGLAGSNNPQSKTGVGPLKSPVLGKFYSKSTIEQTGSDITYGVPLSAGVGVKLHFSERWSLGMGLNYTLLTSRFNGKYIKVNEDSSAEEPVSAGIRNRQHYIGIPLNVYYNIVRHDFINFYAYAGGTVEKCVMNRYEVQTSPMINHKEDVKGVQMSVDAGIGVEFMVSRYAGIYIDPSLRYYFNGGQPKSIRNAQPLMLSFEMGLRFSL